MPYCRHYRTVGVSPTGKIDSPDGVAGGKASISVADHGVGIPSECQSRLFERFYRVNKDRSRALGGTGLGLAIVKHIAQLHGGEASVRSIPGEGSVFTISF